MKAIIECFSATFYKELGFRWPSAAKTLAGSSGGDQSGRINSSHSIIEELRTGWDCRVVTSPGE